ncbi:carbohydrate ABC transporter permease [Streptomyces lavendulae]
MGGYALSRAGWKGRRTVFTLLVATLMFPFESVMISMFLTVREMGLVDTLIGVWLPGAVSVLNIMIMRAAFLAVPREIEEAAVLDGAGEWARFTRVFLPAAKGALAVVCLTSFMGAWDDFLWPLLVLTDSEHYTLQLGLKTLAGATTTSDQRIIAAGAMAAFLPMVLLFFALQRFFFKGVGEGAVKI